MMREESYGGEELENLPQEFQAEIPSPNRISIHDFSLGILRVQARFALLAERLQDLSPRAFRELSVISRSATLRGSRSVAEVVGGYSCASASTALAEVALERKLRGVQKKPEGGVSATAVKASANHHHCC